MQIIEDEHEWVGAGCLIQKGRNGVEQTEPRLARVLELRGEWKVWQQLPYIGDDLGNVCRSATHLSRNLGGVLDADIGPDDLYPGPVGRRPLVFLAAPPESRRPSQLRMAGDLPGDTGFADPRLANQQHQASPAGQRVLQGCLQRPHLGLPRYQPAVRMTFCAVGRA